MIVSFQCQRSLTDWRLFQLLPYIAGRYGIVRRIPLRQAPGCLDQCVDFCPADAGEPAASSQSQDGQNAGEYVGRQGQYKQQGWHILQVGRREVPMAMVNSEFAVDAGAG